LVNFELTVTNEEEWISRMEKTGHQEPTGIKSSTPSRSRTGSGSNSGCLSVGQLVPPFSLQDQDGRTVSLEDFRGKPVAITFIFTRCPLPDYCPRFTNNFAAVQKTLAARFNDQFHLLSISIDPAHDTPQVLKDYGRRSGASWKTWSFLTGSKDALREVADRLGVNFWDEEGTVSHTAACAVITASGTLYKLYRGNTWTPEQIISDMEETMNDER
jgi:protein SCO1/2